MKIAKVDVLEVHTRHSVWRPVLCHIYTDEGIYGDGGVVLVYGTAAPVAADMVRDLATLIIGMDPLDNEVIWDKLYKSILWGQNGDPVVSSGIPVLDIALWDIKDKYSRVPIYKLLGGKRRDNLRTYTSQLRFGWGDVCRDSMEMSASHSAAITVDYVENARKAVAEGYDCIKVDFSTFAPEDGHRYTDEDRTRLLSPKKVHMIEERMAAVWEATGPDVGITMENHSYFDAQPTVQLGRVVQKYNIFYFEEPSTPSVKTTKFICDKLAMPISHGERLYSHWQYAPFFEGQLVQVIQSDLGNCGGLTEGKKICDMAYVYDISVQVHVCASSLSAAVALHLEAVTPNFVIHERHAFNPHEYNRELCTVDLQPVNGHFKVSEEPGLGTEISPWAMKHFTKYTVE